MRSAWLAQREQGSRLFIKACAWLGTRVGWRFGRIVVFMICIYYFFRLRAQHAGSRRFLTVALGRPASLRDVFARYHAFACTIHDRIFFLSGRYQKYDITVHGEEVFTELTSRGQGCILLGGHLGSFDVVRTLGIAQKSLPIRVLMYPDNSRHFSAAQNSLNSTLAQSIIPLGSPGAMLEVKEWVERGGMIGILGDRIVHGEKLVRVPFLGADAAFPAGPFIIASVLKVPIVLFFGLNRGGRRYEIHFEVLTDGIVANRAQRDEAVREHIGRFSARLEHYCRSAPYNWFNFYDFWAAT
jgi:predicted LPLAT superfamily acyltransferase